MSGMEDFVKGAVLRKIGESVGRFADIRTSAKEPQNQIVVQANGEVVKIVAGATYGTLIATVHATTQTFKAVVGAREFLLALKDASPKVLYRFIDLNEGFESGCSLQPEGGSSQSSKHFLRVSTSLPRLLLPPEPDAQSQGTVSFDATELDELGKMAGAVAEVFASGSIYYRVGVEGRITTKNDTVLFGITDNRRVAIRRFKGNYEIFGSIHPTFLEASRAIGYATMTFWTDYKVTLENDMYRAIGPYEFMRAGAPVTLDKMKIPLEDISHRVVLDRSQFIKSLREQAKFDKRGIVGLQLYGDALKVKPFDKAMYGWHVNSKLLLDILGATSIKQVGLGLRTGRRQPINVRIPKWTIEVMPIDLVKLEGSSTSE